jgi:hypothetical protein
VLKQLFQIERDSSQEHRLLGTTSAPRIHAPQSVMLEQAAKYGFHRALPEPAHAAAWLTLLPAERPAVMRVIRRARNLTALALRDAGRFA